PIAIAAFKKLVYKDEVLALMAVGGTVPITGLYRSIEKEKMPSIGASSVETSVKPHKRYVFIPGGTYTEMMYVLCDYIMNDMPIKKPRIAVVVPDHEAGRQDFNSFVERLERYGIKIADKEILNFGAMEATTQVLSIKKANVDYVVMGGSIVQNCNVLLRELKKFGLPLPVFGSWATCSENLVEVSGEAAKNYYGANKFAAWHEDTPGVKLMREITEKYKTREQQLFRSRLYTAGWVSAIVFAEGMKRVGKDLNGEALVDSLESLSNFKSGDLTPPFTYKKNDHCGNRSWKIYKANVEKKILDPVTDWRDPVELK
ncbi:MAG: ABC transporter substrate-binding protein, partial [Pseudomonadota bacterium]